MGLPDVHCMQFDLSDQIRIDDISDTSLISCAFDQSRWHLGMHY